jgi:dTDP-4-amino-4,6-dideoxygalactose transaminase
MGWTVPLADVRVDEEDIAAVGDVYRSGWLSMGPRTVEFEREFADYVGVRHAIAVTNGTAALHLICLAAGLGPGDEVVVPSMTFVATVNAIAYTGATPVFADIAAPFAPWISAESVEEVLTPRTTAVMAMSYGGHPADIAALKKLTERRGLVLLEDAAHAPGARLRFDKVGSFGAAAAFSMFSNKNLSVGEGGIAVTDDDETAEQIRLLRSHGMTTMSWDRHCRRAATYDVVAVGFNYRIDEPRAALAVRRLRKLDHENEMRGRVVQGDLDGLADVDGLYPIRSVDPIAKPAHHLFVVVLDPDVDREEVRSYLASEGIQTSIHYPAVHRFEIYASNTCHLPRTDDFASRCLTLPLFAHESEEQVESVCTALRYAVSSRPRASTVTR